MPRRPVCQFWWEREYLSSYASQSFRDTSVHGRTASLSIGDRLSLRSQVNTCYPHFKLLQDDTETLTSRLNLQHYLWKQQQGYLIHPAISCIQEKSLKIADIGAGTGIWLLDLSEQLPSTVQLDGFDIDVSQCPPRAWLPSNVAMRKLDIHDEIPKELVGVYGMSK